MSEPMTVEELAAYFRVPKSTVYQWTHHSSIPYYKVGRHLRFDLEKVLKTLESSSNHEPGMAPRRLIRDSLKIEEEMRRRRDLHERRLE